MNKILLVILAIILALTNCSQSNLWDNLNNNISNEKDSRGEPIVETLAPGDDLLIESKILGTSFLAGGQILDPGLSPIVEKGVCISVDGVYDNYDCTQGQSVSGDIFKVEFGGLLTNTKYYIKAYADNGSGKVYGGHITIDSGYEIGQFNPEGGIVLYNDGNGGGLMGHEDGPEFIDKKTWTGAIDYCNQLSSNDIYEWYLPSKEELLLINETGVYSPGKYWSSYRDPNDFSIFHSISFNSGFVDTGCSESHNHFVIPISQF